MYLQVRVFYAVRLFLGLLSVVADATLVIALSRKYGKRLASYALAMLCLTSGCFFASTSEWTFFSVSRILQNNILVSLVLLLVIVFSTAFFLAKPSVKYLQFQFGHSMLRCLYSDFLGFL